MKTNTLRDDLDILSNENYQLETVQIISEMDLSKQEKLDELKYSYERAEITLSDYYRGLNLIENN